MRATALLLSAALTLCGSAAFAQSSYNVVVEPVTKTVDAIINAPIEYDENGVVKAQHFKADDLTEEQYQALLAEADRIRAYRAANDLDFESQYQDAAPVIQSTPVAESSQGYEIELFAPEESTDATTMTMSTLKTHTVAKGDTLYNISKRYDTTVDLIQAENGLNGTALSIGQKIRIPGVVVESINTVVQPIFASAPMRDGYVTRRIVEPAGQTIAPQISQAAASTETIYAVLPKDTLYSISRRTCVGVSELISRNSIENPNALTPGQRLTLPAGHCLAR